MRKTRRDKEKIIVSGNYPYPSITSENQNMSRCLHRYADKKDTLDEYLKLDECRFIYSSTPKIGMTERYGIPEIIQVHSEDPLDETLVMNYTDTLRLDGENAGRPIFKVIDSEKFKIIKPELEKLGELKVLKFK